MIFVDTGAWFAVAVRNDPDHTTAMRWLATNREPLVTTDYILAKTATLIRMRDKTARGHRLAVRLATSILKEEAAILQVVGMGSSPLLAHLRRRSLMCSGSGGRILVLGSGSCSPTLSRFENSQNVEMTAFKGLKRKRDYLPLR